MVARREEVSKETAAGIKFLYAFKRATPKAGRPGLTTPVVFPTSYLKGSSSWCRSEGEITPWYRSYADLGHSSSTPIAPPATSGKVKGVVGLPRPA